MPRATSPPGARRRSPSYPGVSLEKAISFAEKISAGGITDRLMPVGAVLTAMGYSVGSGKGNVVLAALKRFGLVDDSGKGPERKAALSDLALRIIRDQRPDQAMRKARIKEAALRPAVLKEVYDYCGSSPTESVLRYHLENEMGFTVKGASDLISVYMTTMAFAGINESDKVDQGAGDNDLSGHEDESPEDRTPEDPPPPPKPRRRRIMQQSEVPIRDFPIPITGGREALVQVPADLTNEDYRYLTMFLKSFKNVIVAEPAAADLPEDGADGGSEEN